METKFTSEKQKELQNKKSMFNFKNVSLMKKQLISLTMAFALVLGLSAGAWAQDLGATAAENNDEARYIMMAGSSYTLTVGTNSNAESTAWTLHHDGTGTVVDGAIAAVSGENTVGFTIDWTQNSVGTYYAQVVETHNSCSTTRRFYITIIDFDVLIYAANADGSHASTAAELAYCGDGKTANYGDMPTGTPGGGDAFSNVFNTDGDLEDYVGADPRTTRYIGIQIIWNLGAAGITAPTVGSMNFAYAVALADAGGNAAYSANTDLYSVNGTESAAATGTSMIALTAGGAANTWDAAAFGSFTAKGPSAILEIVANDRWSSSTVTDLTLDFSVSNVELRVGADGTGTVMGTEPDAYVNSTPNVVTVESASNTAATQTIQLAPATSTITILQN